MQLLMGASKELAVAVVLLPGTLSTTGQVGAGLGRLACTHSPRQQFSRMVPSALTVLSYSSHTFRSVVETLCTLRVPTCMSQAKKPSLRDAQ